MRGKLKQVTVTRVERRKTVTKGRAMKQSQLWKGRTVDREVADIGRFRREGGEYNRLTELGKQQSA